MARTNHKPPYELISEFLICIYLHTSSRHRNIPAPVKTPVTHTLIYYIVTCAELYPEINIIYFLRIKLTPYTVKAHAFFQRIPVLIRNKYVYQTFHIKRIRINARIYKLSQLSRQIFAYLNYFILRQIY